MLARIVVVLMLGSFFLGPFSSLAALPRGYFSETPTHEAGYTEPAGQVEPGLGGSGNTETTTVESPAAASLAGGMTTPEGTPISPAKQAAIFSGTSGPYPGTTTNPAYNPGLGYTILNAVKAIPVIGPLAQFASRLSPNTAYGVDPSLQVGGQGGVSTEAGLNGNSDLFTNEATGTSPSNPTGTSGISGGGSTDPIAQLYQLGTSLLGAPPTPPGGGGGGGGSATPSSGTQTLSSRRSPWLLLLILLAIAGGVYWYYRAHHKKGAPAESHAPMAAAA